MRVKTLRFKNRIFSAPTQIRQKDSLGHMNDYGIAYFEAKAKGGAAQVTIGDTPVEAKFGATQYNSFQLDDPGVLSSLSQVAAAIKQYGAVPSLELSHGGSIASPTFNGGNDPIGPMDFIKPDGTHVRAMDDKMIGYIIDSFAGGAKTIQKAGFDMCTVHAGHGWLLSQFLSPRSNQRTDSYGGSIENRGRLTMEVLDAIRSACGRNFVIELRISGDEFVSGGAHLEDMLEFCSMLDGRADMIHVSAGVHGIPQGLMRMFPSNLTEHGCNVYLAEAVKKAAKVPVSCVGGLSSPAECEEIIASGQADFVAMGRQLIADPDYANKAKKGEDIRPCLRCLNCLAGMNTNRHLTCAVNPTVGIEHRFAEPALSVKKRVLVVGGGAAGMSAALTANKRGHEVVLCEKQSALGGLMNHTDVDPEKADLKAYKDYMVGQVVKSGLTVMLNTDVDEALVKILAPDAIICAVGSSPVVPRVPGIDGGSVMSAMAAHQLGAVFGQKIVVIGGGLVGCETALMLANQGKDVTVLEMAASLAQEDAPLHRMALLDKLLPLVKAATGNKCVSISDEGVSAETAEGEMVLYPADTVIYSIGMRANTEAADSMLSWCDEFIPVGDCNRARKIKDAVSEGYFAALYL